MKTVLKNAFKTNVDPLFFALSCAILVFVSLTAKSLANDVLVSVGGAADNMMMTKEGLVVAKAE